MKPLTSAITERTRFAGIPALLPRYRQSRQGLMTAAELAGLYSHRLGESTELA